MKIVITEDQKKKLFRPIGLSGEDSRWLKWNKEQPIVDGQPINQYTHDGKKNGYWEYYHNGKLTAKGSYKNGMMDGIWEEYYYSGKLDVKGSYKNGKKDGDWEYYNTNGNLISKGSYVNGKKNGVWEYYDNGILVKELPLTESEEPKKKLFRPIGLDSRQEQLKNEIKKFLISIKDSIVWEYLGSIETAYNYDADDSDQSYFDFNGKYITTYEIKVVMVEENGKEKGEEIYGRFYNDLNKITDYLSGLLEVRGDGNVSYVWNEIKDLGKGHLEFNQSRSIKVDKKIKEIKI